MLFRSMGGYNTICSVLSFDKQALIVPRVHPRQEQLIRAQRLAEVGLIDLLHPQQLTASAISHWLQSYDSRPTPARGQIDLNGLDRVSDFFGDLLNGSNTRSSLPLPLPLPLESVNYVL